MEIILVEDKEMTKADNITFERKLRRVNTIVNLMRLEAERKNASLTPFWKGTSREIVFDETDLRISLAFSDDEKLSVIEKAIGIR